MRSNAAAQDRRIALYDDPHSLYCAKCKIALDAKGVAYLSRRVSYGYTNSPEFRRIAPLGKIPVMVVEEAELSEPLVICESEAINEWVEDAFPESAGHVRLMPFRSALRAAARGLSRFHDLYLERALRKTYSQVPSASRDSAVVAAAAAEFESCLSKLEALLEQADALTVALVDSPGAVPRHVRSHPGYCVGRCLSLADVAYGPMFLYADLIFRELGHHQLVDDMRNGAWPRVALLREALASDPHVAKAVAELKGPARAWLQDKLKQR